MEASAFTRHRDVDSRLTTLRVVTDAEVDDAFDYAEEEWEGDPTRRPAARRQAQLRKEQLRAKYGRV